MPTKPTTKKTAQAKKSEAPAKGKKTTAKRNKTAEDGGGDSKNASATGS